MLNWIVWNRTVLTHKLRTYAMSHGNLSFAAFLFSSIEANSWGMDSYQLAIGHMEIKPDR